MPKMATFYYDLSSPYSYLTATQLESLSEKTGATIQWRPVVLGAIFKSTGNVMPASVQAKAQYMFSDLERWRKYYDVPFRFNPYFPVNAMTLHRAIVAVQKQHGEASGILLSKIAFDAVWARSLNITEPDVITSLIDEAGFDGEAILATTSTDEIKMALRQNTQTAIDAGVFGAPSIVVDGELFWGNDRLHFVEEALR